jgi:hypothetical protein
MSNEPLNTLPMQQFIQQVKSADAAGHREIKLDISTAKRLAFTLGEVNARLAGDLEKLLVTAVSKQPEQEIVVKLGSNSNW